MSFGTAHGSGSPAPPRGLGIYSRFPLSDGPPLAPVHAAQPTAVLELPGGEVVELTCVHWRSGSPGSSRRVNFANDQRG